ncbi:MAG TPA: hypothetical protein VKA84_21790 [Gemmatimonadaceae bacterium]|nr:hypothetical protein [Gemmatimonadaceae bacterium]
MPTAVPHRWQNLAPGVSAPPHPAHDAPSTGAPHSVQKRPSGGMGEEQRGQL